MNLVLSLSHLERQAFDGAAIYTLECTGGAYYAGITRRPAQERDMRKDGSRKCCTFTRRPVKLIFDD